MDSISWDVMRAPAIEAGRVDLYHLTATGQPRGLVALHLTTSGWPRGVFTCRLTATGQPRLSSNCGRFLQLGFLWPVLVHWEPDIGS